MARAVEFILRSRMKKDPYAIDVHRTQAYGNQREPCPASEKTIRYFEYKNGRYVSVDPFEIQSYHCRACDYLWDLYARWMRDKADLETGEPADPRNIDEAFAAMAFESYFETFNPPAEEVSMIEYHWLLAVRGERNRIRAQEDYKLSQPS